MKKIILTLVFVFTMGSMVNANTTKGISNSIEVVAEADCFSLADIGASVLGAAFDLSYEIEHEVFLILYDACEAQN